MLLMLMNCWDLTYCVSIVAEFILGPGDSSDVMNYPHLAYLDGHLSICQFRTPQGCQLLIFPQVSFFIIAELSLMMANSVSAESCVWNMMLES